jgi:hypothetical protein
MIDTNPTCLEGYGQPAMIPHAEADADMLNQYFAGMATAENDSDQLRRDVQLFPHRGITVAIVPPRG